MRIIQEKNKAGITVIDLRGRWVTQLVIERMKKIEQVGCFNTNHSIWYHERGVTNNEILITFNPTDRESDIQEVVDYIHLVLGEVIGRGFCTITVNPYKFAYNKDQDALTVLKMIADETDCTVDWGAWLKPVVFHPTNNIQQNKITELLSEFGLEYN